MTSPNSRVALGKLQQGRVRQPRYPGTQARVERPPIDEYDYDTIIAGHQQSDFDEYAEISQPLQSKPEKPDENNLVLVNRFPTKRATRSQKEAATPPSSTHIDNRPSSPLAVTPTLAQPPPKRALPLAETPEPAKGSGNKQSRKQAKTPAALRKKPVSPLSGPSRQTRSSARLAADNKSVQPSASKKRRVVEDETEGDGEASGYEPNEEHEFVVDEDEDGSDTDASSSFQGVESEDHLMSTFGVTPKKRSRRHTKGGKGKGGKSKSKKSRGNRGASPSASGSRKRRVKQSLDEYAPADDTDASDSELSDPLSDLDLDDDDTLVLDVDNLAECLDIDIVLADEGALRHLKP